MTANESWCQSLNRSMQDCVPSSGIPSSNICMPQLPNVQALRVSPKALLSFARISSCATWAFFAWGSQKVCRHPHQHEHVQPRKLTRISCKTPREHRAPAQSPAQGAAAACARTPFPPSIPGAPKQATPLLDVLECHATAHACTAGRTHRPVQGGAAACA